MTCNRESPHLSKHRKESTENEEVGSPKNTNVRWTDVGEPIAHGWHSIGISESMARSIEND